MKTVTENCDFNLKTDHCSPSPDSSENPAGIKVIFSWLFGATNGSHEKDVEKKLFFEEL